MAEKRPRNVLKNYLAFTSDGLKFDEDVARERCPELFPAAPTGYLYDPPSALVRQRRDYQARREAEKIKKEERLAGLNLRSSHGAVPLFTQGTGRHTKVPVAGRRAVATQSKARNNGGPAGVRAVMYDVQLSAGAKPVFKPNQDMCCLVLDSALHYQKKLQQIVPLDPETAAAVQVRERQQGDQARHGSPSQKDAALVKGVAPSVGAHLRPIRGHRRWTSLPAPLDMGKTARLKTPPVLESAPPLLGEDTELESEASAGDSTGNLDSTCSLVVPLPGSSIDDCDDVTTVCHPMQEDFRQVICQWCAAWKLTLRVNRKLHSTKKLLHDMANGGSQIAQCHAVAICAWPNTIIYDTDTGLKSDGESEPASGLDNLHSHPTGSDCFKWPDMPECGLPKDICDKLQGLVSSTFTGQHVKMCALLSLCALNIAPSYQVSDPILDALLEDPGVQHRWVGAQCAALVTNDRPIITKAFFQLMEKVQDTREADRQRALHLLAVLSNRTHLIRVLAADFLNSRIDRERLAVCHLLPELAQRPTADMANKLVFLNWHDTSAKVRKQAAQALISTGNTKLVHDEIWSALLNGDEEEKVAALEKMASFQLLTKRLMPVFMACLKSQHTSVRIAAVNVAGVLKITDDKVIRRVMNQLLEGPPRLKITAYQALCCIRVPPSAELLRHMQWAVQLEPDVTVKAQACHACSVLCPDHPPVIALLRDLLTSSEQASVKEEAAAALLAMGIEPIPDNREIRAISRDLDRMFEPNNVLEAVVRMDRRDQAIKTVTTELKRFKRKSRKPAPA